MTKHKNRETGNRGEAEAAHYLQHKGYKVLERNYRSKWGEIDIIVETYKQTNKSTSDKIVVFVEVKTKTGEAYGEPWEMINKWKVLQIQRMGHLWCEEHGWTGLCRVDVVGVWMEQGGEVVKVEHWENVVL